MGDFDYKAFDPTKGNFLEATVNPISGVQDSLDRSKKAFGNKKEKKVGGGDAPRTGLVASDPAVQAAMERERQLANQRRGKASTILSGNQYETLG